MTAAAPKRPPRAKAAFQAATHAAPQARTTDTVAEPVSEIGTDRVKSQVRGTDTPRPRPDTVKYTVTLSEDEADVWDELTDRVGERVRALGGRNLARQPRRQGQRRRRRVDKSDVLRALVHLASDDAEIAERLAEFLRSAR